MRSGGLDGASSSAGITSEFCDTGSSSVGTNVEKQMPISPSAAKME